MVVVTIPPFAAMDCLYACACLALRTQTYERSMGGFKSAIDSLMGSNRYVQHSASYHEDALFEFSLLSSVGKRELPAALCLWKYCALAHSMLFIRR